MATLDKLSVREQFDKIKVSFDEQVKAGKVTSEVATLVNTLIMLFSIVLSIFLEKKTKKTSANSGIPPSQTGKDETTPGKNKTKGEFPSDLAGPLQYGNGIKAYVVQLLVTQMLSLNRTVKMLAALIGQTLSEATLLSFIMRLHIALEPWETEAKRHLLEAPCIHSDETSCRLNKKNYWIHVYSTGDITLKYLHAKRGKEAMESIDIIPKYGGVIVHDCWSSYLSYNHCQHALCGSHLLRELTFVIDANGYLWAKQMKRLLQRACKMVTTADSKCLDSQSYEKLQRIYKKILVRGENEMPPVLSKPYGRRGRVAKSDAHNLWERLQQYEGSVLMFAKLPHVPFTNNRAERDLRMGKVKQKVSGCFRSEKFAQAYCRISSYLQTMQNQGINPLVAVGMALNNKL